MNRVVGITDPTHDGHVFRLRHRRTVVHAGDNGLDMPFKSHHHSPMRSSIHLSLLYSVLVEMSPNKAKMSNRRWLYQETLEPNRSSCVLPFVHLPPYQALLESDFERCGATPRHTTKHLRTLKTLSGNRRFHAVRVLGGYAP